jgi:preprotein translocase subunit SecB
MSTKANGHDTTNETAPLFNVHSIFMKDLSFEAPHSPQIFNTEWKPKIDFDLQMASQILSEEESIYEVVLHVTVTIKLGEGKEEQAAFLIDIKQAGAFTVKNFTPEATQQLLATQCATVLFPYAREAVSNLVTRGGFPQLVLPPINFDAMYAHHLTTQAAETKPAAVETH